MNLQRIKENILSLTMQNIYPFRKLNYRFPLILVEFKFYTDVSKL